eukprot:257951-Rhodomonas_salina.1
MGGASMWAGTIVGGGMVQLPSYKRRGRLYATVCTEQSVSFVPRTERARQYRYCTVVVVAVSTVQAVVLNPVQAVVRTRGAQY